ncbi:MAG TPA: hypothetical protein VEY88_17910, partial [Archangium sp.]|nr:hypothetical protein [Archangium sp.]
SGVKVVEGKPDFAHPPRADGDGSVLSARAVPVLPIPYRRVDSAAEHVALMSDRDVLGIVERFLEGEAVGTAH